MLLIILSLFRFCGYNLNYFILVIKEERFNHAWLCVQDGSILAWRFNAVGNCFDPPESLTGHNLAVTSLYVGSVRLYSGSKDNTVKVSLCSYLGNN